MYRSELEKEPIAETEIEEMKSAIAGKDVAVIGGHVNWVQKLKQLFPN